jgi:hypothetical protein
MKQAHAILSGDETRCGRNGNQRTKQTRFGGALCGAAGKSQ